MAERGGRLWIVLIGAAMVLLLASTIFAGCGTKEDTTDQDDNGSKVEEEKEITKEVETEVGEDFSVSLEGNPSTGYIWSLSEEPDTGLISLASKDIFDSGDMPGAPAMQVFNFDALAEGSTELKFEYSRPWETDVEPERTCTVSVMISAGSSEPAREFSDPNTPIDVKKGEDFVIALESNPSTGYLWELVEEPDSSILAFESMRYVQPVTEEGTVGAPGKELWRFDTLEAGSAKISFKYVRPWEKDAEPEKTAEFTVNVSE